MCTNWYTKKKKKNDSKRTGGSCHEAEPLGCIPGVLLLTHLTPPALSSRGHVDNGLNNSGIQNMSMPSLNELNLLLKVYTQLQTKVGCINST